MNENILYFEIASLPIFVILIISTIFRGLTKGRSNKLLMGLFVLSFISALSDMIFNLSSQHFPLSDASVRFLDTINFVYFITRIGMIVVYTYYIFSVTRKWYQIKQIWKKLLILVPYIGLVVALVINTKTNALYYVSAESGYHRGDYMMVVYAVPTIYMLFGLTYLIKQRRLLNASEWMSLASLYIFNAIGVIIQLFIPTLLIECYFTSMTLLFLVLVVQKAERQIDMNTGLQGFFAFKSELGKIQKTGQPVQIIIASVDNADEFRRYLGDKAYYEYLHYMEMVITAYSKKERLTSELYFETPGYFYIICEDMDYNPVQAIPEIREAIREKTGNITATGARLDLKVVALEFPKDIGTVKELIEFGHNFTRFAHGKIFCHADMILEDPAYRIENEFDGIIDRAIDNQTLKISYVPVWSVSEGKELFLEANTSVYDEVFGEIGRETLEAASQARGAGIPLEEYVIEQVFSYVGAGNPAKEKISHVIVHFSAPLGMQKNFTDRIWNLRSKYKVHPEQICFAIKEAGYDSMGEGLDDNIKKLALQGYKLALDGYGSGYANIKHLVELPFSLVRLDTSMVAEATNEGGKALLAGMIQMLKNIPLEVVVDGVDDKETKEMLASMGCDLMQGEFFKEQGSEKDSDSR